MIYQRHIPRDELLSAQLEMLLQNSRVSVVFANLIGILAALALFWGYIDFSYLLLWAALFVILLLLRSLHMSNCLMERRYQSQPKKTYWQLIGGAVLTGLIWSYIYIHAAVNVPPVLQ